MSLRLTSVRLYERARERDVCVYMRNISRFIHKTFCRGYHHFTCAHVNRYIHMICIIRHQCEQAEEEKEEEEAKKKEHFEFERKQIVCMYIYVIHRVYYSCRCCLCRYRFQFYSAYIHSLGRQVPQNAWRNAEIIILYIHNYGVTSLTEHCNTYI